MYFKDKRYYMNKIKEIAAMSALVVTFESILALLILSTI